MNEDGEVQQEMVISTEANVVAVTVSRDQYHIAYAMDTEHKCFSQSAIADQTSQAERSRVGFLSFSKATRRWEKDTDLQNAIAGIALNLPCTSDQIPGEKPSNRNSTSLLYGLENLRKRGQEE